MYVCPRHAWRLRRLGTMLTPSVREARPAPAPDRVRRDPRVAQRARVRDTLGGIHEDRAAPATAGGAGGEARAHGRPEPHKPAGLRGRLELAPECVEVRPRAHLRPLRGARADGHFQKGCQAVPAPRGTPLVVLPAARARDPPLRPVHVLADDGRLCDGDRHSHLPSGGASRVTGIRTGPQIPSMIINRVSTLQAVLSSRPLRGAFKAGGSFGAGPMVKILVAVAWPYASGPRHIGHAVSTFIPADIFSRYHRMKGDDVLMVGGSDMHGTPTTVRADEEGVSPDVIANRYHALHTKNIEQLGVRYDL